MRQIKLAKKEQGVSRLILIVMIVIVIVIGAGVGVAVMMMSGGEDDPLAAELEGETAEDGEDGEDGGDGGDAAADAGSKGGHGGAGARALFWSIEPPIVVNYDKFGKTGFLQVSMSIMTYDPAVLDGINQNSPVVRNNLLLLFNGRKYEELIGAENQMRMQEEALSEVNNVLKEFTGKSGANNVYFTSYIMQ